VGLGFGLHHRYRSFSAPFRLVYVYIIAQVLPFVNRG